MDESWRMRTGRGTAIPRRSTEDRQNAFKAYETLDPEDFDDVFGGPPRTVLSRQYSVDGNLAKPSTFFYDDIFRKPKDNIISFRESSNRNYEDVFRKQKDNISSGKSSERTLPEFRIPAAREGGTRKMSGEEFYNDIFGNVSRSRSRSKSTTISYSNSRSKSNSSSMLSSEELSPFRQAIVDDNDVALSTFASKLRPINVSLKRNSSERMHEVRPMAEEASSFHFKCHPFAEKQYVESEYLDKLKGSHSGCSRRVSSPEIMTFGPNSYSSVKESIEDLQLISPSSMVSSLCHEQEDEASKIREPFKKKMDDPEEDEVMSSYVIEINPNNRERIGDAIGINDAIAWAKQKYESSNSEKEWNKRDDEKNASIGTM